MIDQARTRTPLVAPRRRTWRPSHVAVAVAILAFFGSVQDGRVRLGINEASAQGARTSVLRNSTQAVRNAVRNQVRQALRVRFEVREPPRSEVTGIRLSPDGTIAATLFSDGSADVWLLDQGTTIREIPLGRPPLERVAVTRGYLSAIDADGRVVVVAFDGSSRTRVVADAQGRAVALAPLGSTQQVLVGTDRGEVLSVPVADAPARVLWRSGGPAVASLQADPAGTGALVQVADGRVVLLRNLGGGQVTRGSGPAEAGQWSLPAASDVGFAGRGPVALTSDGTVLGLVAGGRTETLPAPVRGNRFLIAEDGAFAVLARNGQGSVWPGSVNGLPKAFSIGMDGFEDASLAPGGNLLLVRRSDGRIDGHDVGSKGGNRVFRLVATRSGWAAVDESGRYDGSLDALREVGWAGSSTFIEIDRYAERYFEPGLVRRYMAQRADFLTAPPTPITDETEVPPPPDVTVNVGSATSGGAPIEVTGQVVSATPVQSVQLFHNGRSVDPSLVSTETRTDGDTHTVTLTGRPVAAEGANDFRIVAETADALKTGSEVASVDVPRPQAVRRPARLVIKSFGIDKYSANELWLNFANVDAVAIADRFAQSDLFEPQDRARSVYLDGEAKRTRMMTELAELDQLSANDMAVIFLAGHGVATPALDDWYFLPQEAESLRDLDHIARVGISDDYLVDLLGRMKAGRVLLMIDSCQSGVVADEFDRYVQRRSLKRVADSTGVQVLAATRADQQAPEIENLGHGLFTYMTLFALSRDPQGRLHADTSPADGRVSVAELRQFVETWVPQYLLQAAAGAQVASVAGTGTQQAVARGEVVRNVVMPVAAAYGRDFQLF